MISAKIIADSISPAGVRLVTFVLEYPRFIHGELMTHRIFSRNAASSRAIPVEKMIQRIGDEPAMPIHWGKNQAGMQAREEHNEVVKLWDVSYERYTDEEDAAECEAYLREYNPIEAWRQAASSAIEFAEAFNEAGYHKQVVNRLTEPFQWMQTLVTATEWDNFFKLRLHPDAQPEFQELAKQMKIAMDTSSAEKLSTEDWHLPFIDLTAIRAAQKYAHDFFGMRVDGERFSTKVDETLAMISVARCARVSYGLNERLTTRDIEDDIKLYEQLKSSGHWSPFEHVATPMNYDFNSAFEHDDWEKGITHMDREGFWWSGNFRGWIQYRQLCASN